MTKRFAISCSSDAELDARRLFVWGGIRHTRWLPESLVEARRRILECRKEYKCERCDAEVHGISIDRTRTTNKQRLSVPKKPQE